MNQHRFGVNAAYLGAKAARTPDERPGPAGWSGALLLDEFYRPRIGYADQSAGCMG